MLWLTFLSFGKFQLSFPHHIWESAVKKACSLTLITIKFLGVPEVIFLSLKGQNEGNFFVQWNRLADVR